jgi:lipoate-protein ligase A
VSASAVEALERGRGLLADARPGDPVTLAWWSVAREALVLGRGERVSEDAAACAREGVAVVQRHSGGGPVLWGPDLVALDVVVPRGHRLFSADVVESYRWLGEALTAALDDLGLDVTLVTPAEARAGATGLADLACFASPSPWEAYHGGRKLVGLSQVRRAPGILLQAGIARRLDLPRLAELLDIDPDGRAALAAAADPDATDLTARLDPAAFRAACERRVATA